MQQDDIRPGQLKVREGTYPSAFKIQPKRVVGSLCRQQTETNMPIQHLNMSWLQDNPRTTRRETAHPTRNPILAHNG